jgi:hypothetical protein
MKSRADVTINGKVYPKGTTFNWYMIYPFFLIHMLAFGLSGFFMAYSGDGPDLMFLYLHGGIAIIVYLVFYLAIFGFDEVKWMFINAALGLLGIYAQINLILSFFGKKASDFPPSVHLVPFLYYILYTFLLYQMVLEVSGSRENPELKKKVEWVYITASVLIYGTIFIFDKGN